MRNLRALWMRMRGLFGSGRNEAQLDAELASHLQMHIDDNVRSGMPPEQAFGQDRPTHADIYRPFDQATFPLVGFTLRTQGDPAAMLKAAEEALWSVDPDQPVFQAIPMEALASQSVALRRASSALIAGFSLLALALACVGIYGLMSYTVTQRSREIGVRIALGAQRSDVLRFVLASGLRLTLIGVAIGFIGSFASSRLLTSLLFNVGSMDPLVFSAAPALIIVVAAIAAFIPAKRAASSDPMRALRAE